MEHVGVRGVVGNWFRSYLSARQQYVYVNGEVSSTLDVTCGVPQGSVLGPLLFIIYINDMLNACPRLKGVHYADDTTLYHSESDIFNLYDIVNDELSSLDQWLISNNLSLNFSKTSYMIVSNRVIYGDKCIVIRDIAIDRTTVTKYLGIYVDDCLNFNKHVDYISGKISKSIGVLYKLKSCLPDYVLRNLYFSMIYPYMLYGVIVWGNSNARNINKITRLQNKFLHLLSGYSTPVCSIRNVIFKLQIRSTKKRQSNLIVHHFKGK